MTKVFRYSAALLLFSFAAALGAPPSDAQGLEPTTSETTTAPAATGKVVGPDSKTSSRSSYSGDGTCRKNHCVYR